MNRIDLNFGHTIGHALETVSSYKIKHGDGVSVGMIGESILSVISGILPVDDFDALVRLIITVGCPINIKQLNIGPNQDRKIINAMSKDKKNVDGDIVFVLPTAIGQEPVLMSGFPKRLLLGLMKYLYDYRADKYFLDINLNRF